MNLKFSIKFVLIFCYFSLPEKRCNFDTAQVYVIGRRFKLGYFHLSEEKQLLACWPGWFFTDSNGQGVDLLLKPYKLRARGDIKWFSIQNTAYVLAEHPAQNDMCCVKDKEFTP